MTNKKVLMQGRRELKFLCDEMTLIQIENRIKGIMHTDIHQTRRAYNIKSVYFDSLFDECMDDNESGVSRRSKYRIRVYDHSDKVIKAEIKSKYHGASFKESSRLTRDQYEAFINARKCPEIPCSDDMKAGMKFYYMIHSHGYRPAAIVEYERTAYTYAPCNVRVTFDKNISVGRDYSSLFKCDMQAMPVCRKGFHILEIKYDEFLPDHLLDLLQSPGMHRTSFSKYYMSRMALRGYIL